MIPEKRYYIECFVGTTVQLLSLNGIEIDTQDPFVVGLWTIIEISSFGFLFKNERGETLFASSCSFKLCNDS